MAKREQVSIRNVPQIKWMLKVFLFLFFLPLASAQQKWVLAYDTNVRSEDIE